MAMYFLDLGRKKNYSVGKVFYRRLMSSARHSGTQNIRSFLWEKKSSRSYAFLQEGKSSYNFPSGGHFSLQRNLCVKEDCAERSHCASLCDKFKEASITGHATKSLPCLGEEEKKDVTLVILRGTGRVRFCVKYNEPIPLTQEEAFSLGENSDLSKQLREKVTNKDEIFP